MWWFKINYLNINKRIIYNSIKKYELYFLISKWISLNCLFFESFQCSTPIFWSGDLTTPGPPLATPLEFLYPRRPEEGRCPDTIFCPFFMISDREEESHQFFPNPRMGGFAQTLAEVEYGGKKWISHQNSHSNQAQLSHQISALAHISNNIGTLLNNIDTYY